MITQFLYLAIGILLSCAGRKKKTPGLIDRVQITLVKVHLYIIFFFKYATGTNK